MGKEIVVVVIIDCEIIIMIYNYNYMYLYDDNNKYKIHGLIIVTNYDNNND